MNLRLLSVAAWLFCASLAVSFDANAADSAAIGSIRTSHSFKRTSQGFRKVAPKFFQNYDFKLDSRTGEIIDMTLRSETEIRLESMSLPFSEESIRSGDFVLQKAMYDKKLGFESRSGRAPWSQVDDAERLVGHLKYRKLSQMESKGLKAARLKSVPWSSTYWPTYAGGVANRYADPSFEISRNWKTNIELLKRSVPESLSGMTPDELDVLSPTEKYDVLVGDPNFTLTRQEFAAAEAAAEANGKIEFWEGKCHGWSPAAFSERRPHHSISVRAYDSAQPGAQGVSVKFYPDDIKALATLLWANAPTQNRFVGSRCNVRDPQTDENGRILEASCFDTNPGTWHLVAVNQIGVNKKGFVLDATYDYQVWNQPAFAYEYSYFDPRDAARNWDYEDDQKFKNLDTLRQAQVDLNDFSEDRFRQYRGSGAVSVVGVHMKFTYVSEKDVSHAERDSAASSSLTSVHYYYDLELDAEGNIVGGEWYQLEHPDFMWAPVSKATAIGDESLDHDPRGARWKKRGIRPISAELRNAALESSIQGQPLARIISELIQKSRKYPGYTVLHFLFGWLERKTD